MIHIGIILGTISFLVVYYFIKKEIMCKCDDDQCDCYTKKNNMAIKYGLLTGLSVFASVLIVVYYEVITKTLIPEQKYTSVRDFLTR
jgi:hypothetical protein